MIMASVGWSDAKIVSSMNKAELVNYDKNSRIVKEQFFSSRRGHTSYWRDWSSDVCSSDLAQPGVHGVCWHAGRMTSEPDPLTVPRGIPALEAATPAPRLSSAQVLIITGMSGAGRTKAAAVLEDLDWYVVDNLPAQMLTPLVGMMQRGAPGGGVQRLAAVVDVRGGEFFADLAPVLADMRAAGTDYRI